MEEIETRSVPKSLRIPIPLDDKIEKFRKEESIPNSTQACIILLQIGLFFHQKFEEMKDSTEELAQIKEEKDRIIAEILSDGYIIDKLKELSEEELELIFTKCYKEMARRNREEQMNVKEEAMKTKERRDNKRIWTGNDVSVKSMIPN